MVGLIALWKPIVVSAVFVFIALSIIHGMLGWHKGDMTAVPGEAKVMETLRGLNVQPGDYRFPHGIRRCALAELDLVGQEHAIHGDELARRHHLRPDHRRDVRLAVATLTEERREQIDPSVSPRSGRTVGRSH